MFKRTRQIENGHITVTVKVSMTGYCVHIDHLGTVYTSEVYSRRHIAVNVASAILEAA